MSWSHEHHEHHRRNLSCSWSKKYLDNMTSTWTLEMLCSWTWNRNQFYSSVIHVTLDCVTWMAPVLCHPCAATLVPDLYCELSQIQTWVHHTIQVTIECNPFMYLYIYVTIMHKPPICRKLSKWDFCTVTFPDLCWSSWCNLFSDINSGSRVMSSWR